MSKETTIMPDLADVLKSALSLSIDDRAALADRLLASLDELDEDEAERLWSEEARRRRGPYQAGRGIAPDAQSVAHGSGPASLKVAAKNLVELSEPVRGL